MTTQPVELAPEALAEAWAAEDWYRVRSEQAAARFVAELEHALVRLGENPAVGPRWEHPHLGERVRKLAVHRFPFVLFYVVGASGVRVLAVAHTSREPGYWASRLEGQGQ